MIKTDELLKSVTTDVVINIMQENGSPVYYRTIDRGSGQECLWFRTICHGGDSHKLCYFTESKDFYCYTSCGRMPFFDFIKRLRNAKDSEFYSKVITYVAQKVGIKLRKERQGFDKDNDSVKETKMEISEMESILEDRERRKNRIEHEITTFFNPVILNFFEDNVYYTGWVEDGISDHTMKKFGIRWWEPEKHIIIPHFNIDGKLVGIRRRSLKPEDSKRKYMPEYLNGVLYDHPLGLNLYGLYENKEAIKRNKRAIIVEGEKSVLLSDTFYGKDSCTVATCGFNVSEWQLKMLLKLNVEEIYLGFDKDYDMSKEEKYKKNELVWKNYLRYKERLYTLGQRMSPFCKVFLLRDMDNILGIKDSPFDRGKEIFEELMRKKKPISTIAL